MTIGPEAWANASRMIVRLAVPAAAPPASAHSRKLRRESFFAMTRPSVRAVEVIATIQDNDARFRADLSDREQHPNIRWRPFPSETHWGRASARFRHFVRPAGWIRRSRSEERRVGKECRTEDESKHEEEKEEAQE